LRHPFSLRFSIFDLQPPALFLTPNSFIRFRSARGADPLFGVIGDLRSLDRKTPLRMRVSEPQAAREVTNRRIKINLVQNQASTLD
jgi:hypothetical protein